MMSQDPTAKNHRPDVGQKRHNRPVEVPLSNPKETFKLCPLTQIKLKKKIDEKREQFCF